MKNADLRVIVESLVHVEQRIDAALSAHQDQSWSWAPWSKPSSGGPFLWNDIVVVKPDNKKRTIEALSYVEESE